MIPVSDISVHENRIRRDVGNLDKLADEISKIGVLTPIVVIQYNFGRKTHYYLVTGERILAAAKKLGQKRIIACIINYSKFKKFDILQQPMYEHSHMPATIDIQLADITTQKGLTESELSELQSFLYAYYGEFIDKQGLRTDLLQARGSTSTKSLVKVPTKHGAYGWIADRFKGVPGNSHTQIQKRLEFFRSAWRNPKLYEKLVRRLDNKQTSLNKAWRQMKRIEAGQMLLESPEVLDKEDGRILLFNKDIRELSQDIKDNSVDLVFTDPPYSKEYLHLYSILGELAFKKLKPGGSLVTYLGHAYLPEVIDSLKSAGLTYQWVFGIPLEGDTGKEHSRRIFIKFKPLLFFTKGKKRSGGQYLVDFVKHSKKPEKLVHKWEQSDEEALYYIKGLTSKHGVVLDPFLGSGTTGVAAVRLGRQFIGCEIDPTDFKKAEKRIARAQNEKGGKQKYRG